ncbi:hypothetical protein OAF86_02560 [Flavobacteriaceae bacterium]|nr:hypothetical protein [Flavobacteriaceae bacterium]MDB4738396.1 hypothetical protein [Flavobacteriaceae bacterium]MDB4751488.1 hypothetical protein [Flavobacteriaceae bacterium]
MQKQKPYNYLKTILIILLVWNIIGILFFLQDVFLDPKILTENQLEFCSRFPFWIKIIYALAVFGGTIGTFGLIKRKSWSHSIVIVSMLAVIVQMYHSIFIANSLEFLGNSAAILPTIIIVLSIVLAWIAETYKRNNWFI